MGIIAKIFPGKPTEPDTPNALNDRPDLMKAVLQSAKQTDDKIKGELYLKSIAPTLARR